MKDVYPGDDCDNPYYYCKDNSKCVDGYCTKYVKPGEKCNPPGIKCEAGYECGYGPDGYKICKLYRKLGETCPANEPYYSCYTDLKCVDGVCKKPILKDQACNNPYYVCPTGTYCLGPHDHKKCKTYMQLGQECEIDPYWFCAPGLTCKENKCVKVLKPSQTCNNKHYVCPEGTYCLGKDVDRKKCKPYMKLGEECEIDPYWVCHPDYMCKNNKCVKLIKIDQTCNNPHFMCPDGTYCVGPKIRKKCKKLMDVGQPCENDPYWFCKYHLKCVNNICVA